MKLLLLAAASLLSAPVLAEPPGGKLAPVAPQAVPKETAVTTT